jgi:hypothetical protein
VRALISDALARAHVGMGRGVFGEEVGVGILRVVVIISIKSLDVSLDEFYV